MVVVAEAEALLPWQLPGRHEADKGGDAEEWRKGIGGGRGGVGQPE